MSDSGTSRSVLIVGAGVFGTTAAIELRRRGHQVDLLDPGPLPHPQASSTDISKAVRMDYGHDGFYSDLAARALDGWRAWNRGPGAPLFHDDGILLLSPRPMSRDGFEGAGFETMRRHGVAVERCDAEALARRFPAWGAAPYVDGYFNPEAGWVESRAVVARLIDEARALGVTVRDGVRCAALVERGSRVVGATIEPRGELRADVVLVAAGAWTTELLPELAASLRPNGQPVLHLEPRDPAPFRGERFPVWCADIANTGWYGFPLTAEGLVKIGNHGPGREVERGEPLEVSPEERRRCLEFVEQTLPALAGARVRSSRLCLYCDSWDGNFLIDYDPDRPGLFVASGGSGHGFKFAPLLGGIIADRIEGKPDPWAARFAWREPGKRVAEHARRR